MYFGCRMATSQYLYFHSILYLYLCLFVFVFLVVLVRRINVFWWQDGN